MKKIYNQPELKVVLLQHSMMIAGFNSTLNANGQDGREALVKGDLGESTSSDRGYNVWDDDWSE